MSHRRSWYVIILKLRNYVGAGKIFAELIASDKATTKFGIIPDLRKFWLYRVFALRVEHCISFTPTVTENSRYARISICLAYKDII